MDYLEKYLEVLRDPSLPENRIHRKVLILTVFIVLAMAFYRHIVLELDLFEPLLVTLALAFLIFSVVGLFGAALAGGFYVAFLKTVGAGDFEVNFIVHATEWLFALCAPFLGILLAVFLLFQQSISMG